MRNTLLAVVLSTMLAVLSSPVFAKDLQLSCTLPTICTSMNGILVSSSSTLDLVLSDANNKYSGSAWLAIIVPDGGAGVGATLSENGGTTDAGTLFQTTPNVQMWGALGENGGTSDDHNYGSTEGKSPSTSGYTIYDILLTSNFTGPVSLTATAPGPGTLFVGFTENSKDNVALATPWSESIFAGGGAPPAPEPASLFLLGSGLLGLGALLRRFHGR